MRTEAVREQVEAAIELGGTAPVEQAEPTEGGPGSRSVLGWLRSDLRASLSVAVLALLVLISVFAPALAPHPVDEQDLRNILGDPSGDHLLGTDDLGRDVLSRLIHGTRVSLSAAFLAVGIALLLGVPVGLFAGFTGGIVDDVVMRIVDTLLSFPAIILAIGVTGALGPSLTNAMLAIGIVFSPIFARIMRSQVLSVKEDLYVEAARSFGGGDRHIILRHIVPNAIQPVIVQSALLLALALLAEASLSFLGLGVQPPEPSWGFMLGRAYRFMQQAPLQMLAPGIAIVVTVLAFNVLGDSLRTALDPMSRNRAR